MGNFQNSKALGLALIESTSSSFVFEGKKAVVHDQSGDVSLFFDEDHSKKYADVSAQTSGGALITASTWTASVPVCKPETQITAKLPEPSYRYHFQR